MMGTYFHAIGTMFLIASRETVLMIPAKAKRIAQSGVSGLEFIENDAQGHFTLI